jgi:hypothetical protein
MTEAEFIAALRRLPLHPAARGLNDDTALLDAGPLVVTTDTLVEGVHFLPIDPAQDVAWKLVATNLSDLAAKGAVPEGILLNYPLGDDAWDRTFLEGLADILTAHDTRLIGGVAAEGGDGEDAGSPREHPASSPSPPSAATPPPPPAPARSRGTRSTSPARSAMPGQDWRSRSASLARPSCSPRIAARSPASPMAAASPATSMR